VLYLRTAARPGPVVPRSRAAILGSRIRHADWVVGAAIVLAPDCRFAAAASRPPTASLARSALPTRGPGTCSQGTGTCERMGRVSVGEIDRLAGREERGLLREVQMRVAGPAL
jgi:hypothetical protein